MASFQPPKMVGWLAVDSLQCSPLQLQKYPLNQNCHNIIVTDSHWSPNNNASFFGHSSGSPPFRTLSSVWYLTSTLLSLRGRGRIFSTKVFWKGEAQTIHNGLILLAHRMRWHLNSLPSECCKPSPQDGLLLVISRVVITPLMGVKNPSYRYSTPFFGGYL